MALLSWERHLTKGQLHADRWYLINLPLIASPFLQLHEPFQHRLQDKKRTYRSMQETDRRLRVSRDSILPYRPENPPSHNAILVTLRIALDLTLPTLTSVSHACRVLRERRVHVHHMQPCALLTPFASASKLPYHAKCAYCLSLRILEESFARRNCL